MKDYIRNRTKQEAECILQTDETIREIASDFGVSKSTVFRDFTLNLPKVNYSLYLKVKQVLKRHKRERALRGGMATKRKYERMIN